MDEGVLSDFCIKGGGVKCGRWNPTGEQVKVLLDLFKAGLRTPSAEQIQNISYELSFYGKIESKNVFYWFQNHKARERQKRRRVSIDKKDAEKQEKQKIANTAFPEVNTEQEKVIKTLQLFPLKSYEESEAETFRYVRRGTSKESTFSSFGASLFSTNIDPLDLRLSS